MKFEEFKPYNIEVFDLSGNRIWIEDRGIEVDPSNITVGPRIGIDYAGEDANLPYRFLLENDVIQLHSRF